MPLACPCCGAAAWRPLHAVAGHRYVACTTCATGRLDPLPAPVELAASFGLGYFDGSASGGYLDYDGEAAARQANADATLRRLHERRPTPGRLLEVGAASGWFLARAAEAGWEVTGVELNDEMRRRAAARTPATTTLHASLDEVPDTARVDAAVLVQVLEHLVDPGSALDRLAAALEPGGALLVETWDRRAAIARVLGKRWQQVTPPSVVWLFSADGIVQALHRRGFTDVAVRRTAKRVGVGSVLGLLADRTPAGGRRLRRLAEGDRVRAATIPYRLGDLITVSATFRGPAPARA